MKFRSVPRVLLPLALVACAPDTGVTRTPAPGGATSFTCELSLPECLGYAERLCRGASYTVLGANDVVRLYGAPTGESQVEIRTSQAVVRCLGFGEDPPELVHPEPPPSPAPKTPAPQPQPKPPATSTPAVVPAAAARAPLCVPGASSACVGKGGCQGGQICRSDGQGFEPCDCEAASPAPPPSAPPP